MVAIPIRAVAPCPDAVLRGTRLRGRGGRVTDPSSLSWLTPLRGHSGRVALPSSVLDFLVEGSP